MERIRPIGETAHTNSESGEGEELVVRSHIPAAQAERELTPDALMIRRYLDSIDEQALEEVIADTLRKTGRDESIQNIIPLNRIHVIDDETQGGLGGYGDGKIILNAHYLKDNPTEVLHTLIHEQLHATSDQGFERDPATYAPLSRVGLHRQSSWGDETGEELFLSNQYKVANEGMTEFLTERITREYLARTGDTAIYGEDEIENNFERALFEHGYGQFRARLELYFIFISALADVPRSVIEDTITRAYFRGGSVLPQEAIDEIEELQPGLADKIHGLLQDEELDLDNNVLGLVLSINQITSLPIEKKNELLTQAIIFMNEWSKYTNKKQQAN
ncbi:hypothetical protein KC887_03975 [Candidatus Kaiserbacteria bacterium]|nr:hypothetical protein [Candidatus Kaiserbacteria bacterium]